MEPDQPVRLAPMLLPHALRALAGLIPIGASLVIWTIGTGFSILAGLGAVGGRGLDLGAEVDSGLTLIGLVGMGFFGLVWLMLLFVGVREVVAEGGVLVEDGAGSAANALAAARTALERHSATEPGELDGSSTLRVANGREQAMVMIRTVGPDLRIGWTVWRVRSTVNMIIEMVSGRRGGDLATLQADYGSSMTRLVASAVDRGAAAR
jgi:hypothetical protein